VAGGQVVCGWSREVRRRGGMRCRVLLDTSQPMSCQAPCLREKIRSHNQQAVMKRPHMTRMNDI
jgi:hypothetical protein